jgi:hypothetical protein
VLTSRTSIGADVQLLCAGAVVAAAILPPRSGVALLPAAALLAVSLLVAYRTAGGWALTSSAQVVVGLLGWWYLAGGLARIAVTDTFSADGGVVAGRVVAAMLFCSVGAVVFVGSYRLVRGAVGLRGLTVALPMLVPGDRHGLACLAGVAVMSQLLYSAAVTVMPGAVETVGLLGGTQTNVWWIGVLGTCARVMGPMAAVMGFVLWWRARAAGGSARGLAIVTTALCLNVFVPGLLSGWKAPTVELIAGLLLSTAFLRQRVPWLVIAMAGAFYVFLLEPSVRLARDRAFAGAAGGPEDVGGLVVVAAGDVLRGDGEPAALDSRASTLLAPFRGLAELGGEIVLRATASSGGGHFPTVSDGVRSTIPRVLLPTKPELDVGNAFARDYGVDLDIVSISDRITNLSPSVTMDVVSEFGRLAGLVTFALLGILWAIAECLLLGPASKAGPHPLVGWFAFFGWKIESNVASWLAEVRDLAIAMVVFTLVLSVVANRRSQLGRRESST